METSLRARAQRVEDIHTKAPSNGAQQLHREWPTPGDIPYGMPQPLPGNAAATNPICASHFTNHARPDWSDRSTNLQYVDNRVRLPLTRFMTKVMGVCRRLKSGCGLQPFISYWTIHGCLRSSRWLSHRTCTKMMVSQCTRPENLYQNQPVTCLQGQSDRLYHHPRLVVEGEQRGNACGEADSFSMDQVCSN